MRDGVRQQDFAPGSQPRVNGAAPRMFTAAELMRRTFPAIEWVVPGVMPIGLTGLGGKPKSGKSYMMLGTAVAVATGGETLGKTVQQGDALYLALEDTDRRLFGRLDQILNGAFEGPERLTIVTEWPRLDQGGLQQLENWAKAAKQPRLIEVDVLGKVRPARKKDEGLYDDDYRAVTGLKTLADRYKMGVRFAHHLNKQRDVEDPLDAFSGTTGLTGACDTLLVMRQTANGTVLYGRGRDVDQFEKAMSFDKVSGTWSVLGEAGAVAMSDQRRQILDVIDRAVEAPTVADVMHATGMKRTNVWQNLSRMMRDGEVQKASGGGHRYERAQQRHNDE
jgi:AAA domain-containing protein